MYTNSNGIAILHLFCIAWPVARLYVPLCKRIFKIEGGYFKFIHTMNVPFIDSELPEEQSSHIISSNNDSLK